MFGLAALIGAGITAFYMSRLFFMTFHGEKRWTEKPKQHPHESPALMTVPMIILAVGSAVPRPGPRRRPTRSTHWLAPVVGAPPDEDPVISVGRADRCVTLVLVARRRRPAPGCATAQRRCRRSRRSGRSLTQAARQDLYQDAVNEALLMRPGEHLTRSLVFVDGKGVDGAVGGLAALIGGFVGPAAPAADRLRPVLRPDHAGRRRRRPRRPGGDPMSFPWLTVIGAVPLVGAAVVLALPGGLKARARADRAGLLARLAGARRSSMALQFKRNSSTQFQFAEVHQWIPQFGVSYARRRRRHRAGADRAGRRPHAGLHPGRLERRARGGPAGSRTTSR